MPSRLTLALAGLVLLLCAALYGTARWGLSNAATARLLEGEVVALGAEVQVLDSRLRGVQVQLERQRKLRKPAEEALNENPEWRDTAVPAAVADGLCARIRCAGVHPVPTSNR